MKCCGLIGLIFGHKYIPIMSRGASSFSGKCSNWPTEDVLDAMDKYRDETFVGLMCKRCGETKQNEL